VLDNTFALIEGHPAAYDIALSPIFFKIAKPIEPITATPTKETEWRKPRTAVQ
jgi:hypothetical protein